MNTQILSQDTQAYMDAPVHGPFPRITEGECNVQVPFSGMHAAITAVQSAPGAAFCMDLDGMVLTLNQAAEKLFGWKGEDIAGKDFCAYVLAPGMRARHYEGLRHFRKSGKAHMMGRPLEVLAMNRKQVYFPVEMIVSPVLTQDAQFCCVHLKDLTSAYAREQARSAELQQLSDLVNAAGDLIWSVDESLRLTASNQAFGEFARNIGAEPVKGMLMLDKLLTSGAPGIWKDRYNRALRGESFTISDPGSLPGGLHNEISFYPFWSHGKIAGVSCYARTRYAPSGSTRESEGELRLVMNAAMDAMVCTDRDGMITAWNPQAEKMFGWKEHEVSGRLLSDVMVRGGGNSSQAQFLSMSEPLLNGRVQLSLGHRNGTTFFAEVSILPVGEGEEAFYCAFIRDLTERMEAEQKIRDSEGNLKAIFENTSEGFILFDEQGVIRFFNHAASTFGFLNMSTDMKPGRSIFDFVDGDRMDFFRAVLEKVKQGETIAYDRMYEQNGLPQWIHYSITPVKDAGGVRGFCLTGDDVTVRKQAEEALQKSEGQLRTLFENTDDLIWSVGPDLRFIALNSAVARKMTSIYNHVVHPGDDALMMFTSGSADSPFEWETYYRKALAGEQVHFEKHYMFFDSRLSYEFTMTPIHSEGQVTGVSCFAHNITERIQGRLLLEQQNQELKKINAELDRFVYSTSHDLRSPLTSILGLLDFIEEETQENDTREHASMIRNRIHRLDDFIHNILTYSRNNRVEVAPETFAPSDTANGIIDSLRNMKDAEGIGFSIDIREAHRFASDRQRISTVVENIVSNAIKYHRTEGNDRLICIYGHTTPETLILSIQDNGIGMSEEHVERIFDMFFRIPGPVAGSGIGLYIVKEIMERMEGSIRVESAKGQGTTFHLTFKNLL